VARVVHGHHVKVEGVVAVVQAPGTVVVSVKAFQDADEMEDLPIVALVLVGFGEGS